MTVVYSTEKNIPSKNLIGGKAYGLHEVQKILKNVPRWATLTTEFFAGQSLSDSFSSIQLARLEEVWNTISKQGTKAVAVRSSAADEDGLHLSFAGQMDSFLQIGGFAQFLQAIRDCWASLYGERAVAYRRQNGIDPWKAKMAIIVQEMVPAEVSGVIFTANPINHRYDEMLITSAQGLGEAIVSGKIDTDTHVLGFKGEILRQELITHSLNAEQLKLLHSLARALEKKKQIPLDIEFSIAQGEIYFLQARPITSIKKKDALKIWDNSNIVESYSGVTTPLTFSFIQKAYFAVYCQFCETIGVDQQTIFKNRHVLENMLGLIQGRVYYNLLNWYKLISLMPGFHYNKAFMEQMMGLQVVPDCPAASKKAFDLPRLLGVGLKMSLAHFRLPKEIAKFQGHFASVYTHYSGVDFSKKSPAELLAVYRNLEEEILWKWRAPITNDFEAMIFYGLLKKMTVQWNLGPDGMLQNDLLSGEGNIHSTELIASLAAFAAAVEKDEVLREELLQCTPEEALVKLQSSRFSSSFAEYLRKYGVRCINEMKLESVPIKDNPLFCIRTIQNYLRNGVPAPAKQQELRAKAEQVLGEKLKGWRKIVYNWVLKHCRRAIKNRENQRFARTQAYDLVRTLVRSIGTQWAAKEIIQERDDIFFLRIDEIWSYIEGTSVSVNLKELIALRKQEFESYLSENPDDHIETEGEVYSNNPFSKPYQEQQGEVIQGLGCCSGIVEREVQVVLSPDKNLQLNQEIMVAKQTDPGWGILFPSVSGLIIEKGSMLSHSAIVAREMGIPTVIGVKNATQILATGDRVILDGAKGTIQIVKRK
jgi:rifampicin phosphotransferase